MASFTPIPAVDIRGGRCVRLVQGDFSRETAYADDPVAMARHWQTEGAQRLHVVDLDGARDGVRANADAIASLLRSVTIPVQVGGGIRSLDDIRALIDLGADRVIVGTLAIQEPEIVPSLITALGSERLVVGLDARDGRLQTHGWTTVSAVCVIDYATSLANMGVQRVVYTDVGRDGVLNGPDVETTAELAKIIGVIGSGGVSSIDHLRALAEAGAEGAIVGTALYEGRLSLRDAMAAAC